MLALQIENSSIESIFTDKFNSNKKDFIDFIAQSVEKFKKPNDGFIFDTLNPELNSYTIVNEDKEIGLTNPFKDIDDTLSFSKSLREKSYR